MDLRIPAKDGYSLAATLFRPDSRSHPGRITVIQSATGVPRSYYRLFAEYLRQSGHAVVTFDYRGIGESRPRSLRRSKANLSDWGRLDTEGVLAWALANYPGHRLSVVAHSVGGQIFGLATSSVRVDDLLAVGAQSGYWGHWPRRTRWRLLVLWYLLIPVLSRAFGYFPSQWVGLGLDLPAGVAREWAWWGRHPDYVLGRVDAADRDRFERYSGRLLALAAEDDSLAPPASGRALFGINPGACGE